MQACCSGRRSGTSEFRNASSRRDSLTHCHAEAERLANACAVCGVRRGVEASRRCLPLLCGSGAFYRRSFGRTELDLYFSSFPSNIPYRRFFGPNSTLLRARFLMRMGVPVKPKALRIWFSTKRS